MESKDKKSIINEMKQELDDMEVMLKKSGGELKDAYQEKKKKFASLLKAYAKQLETSGNEKIHELRDSSMELIDMLEADYNLSYTEFDEHSHKVTRAIEKLEKKAREVLSEVEENSTKAKARIEGDFKKNMELFKTELDIQKAHFKSTKERASQGFDEWKKARLVEIESMKKQLDQKKEVAEEKFEKFNEELSESFSHLKSAFKKLW